MAHERRTPLALFAYNRPQHVQLALESLVRCSRLDEVDIYIYCDGARGPGDQHSVAALREVVHAWAPRIGATLVEAPHNQGPDRSIAQGVTSLCEQYGRVIVIEDDHVVSPDFLDYMLSALDRYQDDRRVYQVSGFLYPIDAPRGADAFFLPLVTSRGWATWDRAWRAFDWGVPGVQSLFTNRFARYRFDYGARYGWSHMLHQGLKDGDPNWDTVWYWSVFRRAGLTLFPKRSLVWVGGWDGTGVHCGTTATPQDPLECFTKPRLSSPMVLPEHIVTEREAFTRIKRFAGREEGYARPVKRLEALIFDELLMYHPKALALLQPLRRRILSAQP